MGSGISQLWYPCFQPQHQQPPDSDLIFTASEPLDETLGHSFCYVRSSNRFLSPAPSDRFISPSHSLRFSPPRQPPSFTSTSSAAAAETCFKAISGASVSANTSTPRTVLQLDGFCGLDNGGADDFSGAVGGSGVSIVHGFESTSSFCALPLQPVPRGGGGGDVSGPMERGFFMSGPIERGALSGPLDGTAGERGGDGGVHFSAPLGGLYVKRKRKKGISGIRKAFNRSFSEKKRPWVVPVLNFVGRKDVSAPSAEGEAAEMSEISVKNNNCNNSVHWALGKAGEDRVHVVVSEEHGWLFVGIYDGFNGPDAPEFLMGNLYRAVFNELKGLFWESEEQQPQEQESVSISVSDNNVVSETSRIGDLCVKENDSNQQIPDRISAKRVTFHQEETQRRRKHLWEFLAEEDPEDGLDLSGSDRFAFSVDDALSVSNAGSSAVKRRSLLLSKLKHGLSKQKEGLQGRKFFAWRFGVEDIKEKVEEENRVEERTNRIGRRRKVGPVDHELVLRALSRALEVTELAYLDMTDKVLDRNPELALMGSCLLVVLMRDEDVYVMNVGDSRAIVAQYEPEEVSSSVEQSAKGSSVSNGEGIVGESSATFATESKVVTAAPPVPAVKLTALQLSTDHSTSTEEEVIRIKNEHPDDNQCIVNDRVKGRLKVTRAFGAGFLKRPKLNDALLEMFRNEYIGTAPYISCSPSLRHHKLCPRDQFLVLSSDGLYQYLSNQEVVSHVENLMDKFPDGDPAQHLIEELLFRAAKKAGMDFHELLDIPQGDRRKYHDDVTVMVISLEGRIWKSSGKYL
ncbi:PPM-type phosphatase-like domain [Dillenia turbinata]|uniref:PPM-type phosphatase-like domain n=1 Tax=Dillenia turbinata TaxID=194707 RepID=A0AAN8ZRI9_9MAGN